MDDALPDVPETQIDDTVVSDVETHVDIEPSGDTNIDVSISPPDEPILSEVETDTPLPSNEEAAPQEGVTSDVTNVEEPIVVASDVTPNSEAAKEVTTEVKRTPDSRPKRRLGWRAYILGGSGGTK
jgi:hypothetical protein